MRGSGKKCKNPPFLGILGQNAPFWTVFGQNGQNGNFFKKALGTFFSHLQALTDCKVSEKSNEQFPRKSVADGRTNGRTDATPKVSTTSWSRDQTPNFYAFLRGLRRIKED